MAVSKFHYAFYHDTKKLSCTNTTQLEVVGKRKVWKMHITKQVCGRKRSATWEKRGKIGIQSKRRQWNEPYDAMWRHSERVLRFNEPLCPRFVFYIYELYWNSKAFRLLDPFHLVLSNSCIREAHNDCVTFDRSVDELLMRSHFFTLHRRLSEYDGFSVCHRASIML